MYSAACYYVKRSQRIYEKVNEYYEDAFLKRLKKKPARPRSSIGRSHIIEQCGCSTPGAIILPSFLHLRVDGRKRLEYATCGRNVFQKRRKKPPFSKIAAYVWTGRQFVENTTVYVYHRRAFSYLFLSSTHYRTKTQIRSA